jgi:hypothetical protein
VNAAHVGIRRHALLNSFYENKHAMKSRGMMARLALLMVVGLLMSMAQAKDFTAGSADQVIEKLAPRSATSLQANDPVRAEQAARAAITQARESADPRYLGRAQAILAPWWSRADAPVEIATLQATILQSRHEFSAARTVLQTVVQSPAASAQKAQAWLTLATLDRLQADYRAALHSCEQVARSGEVFYAQACQLETVSLMGQQALAQRGFEPLMAAAQDAATRAWLLSLQAEHFERVAQDDQAAQSYQQSLQLAQDSYTALAAADLWLRRGQGARALAALAQQAESDSVLLRKAYALKLQGDARWQTLADVLQERFAALDARRDDPAAHARERALYHLWIDGDTARALISATLNLVQQREPIDWWLALSSAERAGQSAQLARFREQLDKSGLRDARLAKWQTAAHKKGTS